jgi:hypothetical protein
VLSSHRQAHPFKPNLRASNPNLRSRRSSSRSKSSRLHKTRWVPQRPSLRMRLESPRRNLQV